MTKVVAVSASGDLEEVEVTGGSAVIKSVEIDFGAAATKRKTFTIVDVDVSPTTLILIGHSAQAATGRSQDENEMDFLFLRAAGGTGEFTLYADAFPNFVSGKFRVNYLLG